MRNDRHARQTLHNPDARYIHRAAQRLNIMI
jgi:hypothetical protein